MVAGAGAMSATTRAIQGKKKVPNADILNQLVKGLHSR